MALAMVMRNERQHLMARGAILDAILNFLLNQSLHGIFDGFNMILDP